MLNSKTVLKKILLNVTKNKPHSLHEPFFDKNEEKLLSKCIKTGYVSTVGNFVNLFEKKICELTKSKYCVATVNGTSAIHIGLLASNIKPNEEILMPSLGFVAAANAINYCGAIPHFVDSESLTLGVDPIKLEKYLTQKTKIKNGKLINITNGRNIKALISIHMFGNHNNVDMLNKVCKKFKILHFEDAAEAIGSYYKKKHMGTFSHAGFLSFNGNKTITTGGGGAILTNNKKLAELCRHISSTAKIKHSWELSHDRVGFNYRMPNLNAALGLAQLKKLRLILKKKRKLHEIYKSKFINEEKYQLLNEQKFSRSNYWLNTLLLKEESINLRNGILSYLNKNKIVCRPTWKLLHKLSMYKRCPKANLKSSISLEKKIINIPSSPSLV